MAGLRSLKKSYHELRAIFDLPCAGGARTTVVLVVFFVVALPLYSAACTALGAAGEVEQHRGRRTWPVRRCALQRVRGGAILRAYLWSVCPRGLL